MSGLEDVALWNAKRSHHYERLTLIWVDNMMGAVSVFMTVYFSTFKKLESHQYARYIGYWFPVIMLCHIASVQYNCIMNSIFSVRLAQIAQKQYKRLHMIFETEKNFLLLDTPFLHSVFIPLIFVVMYTLMMSGYGLGKDWQIVEFTIIADLMVIAAAIIIAYLQVI